MNLYGHGSSTGGNHKTYIDYAVAKPHMWATNAAGLYDWWVKRDPMVVTPSYSKSGETAIATAAVSGATDAETAIELVLPNWSSGVVGNLEVRLNGAPAAPASTAPPITASRCGLERQSRMWRCVTNRWKPGCRPTGPAAQARLSGAMKPAMRALLISTIAWPGRSA